jgi:hypothetical protein
MALSLPVSRSVAVTASRTYVVTVALCNTNASSSFVGKALPLFANTYGLEGFSSSSATSTSTISFYPGEALQYVATSTTASTSSETIYPVFAYRDSVALSCSRSGTAVNVTIPFGSTYSTAVLDETDLSCTPSKYYYVVNYGDTSGPAVVTGNIDISIKTTTTTSVSSFSVCSVSVT